MLATNHVYSPEEQAVIFFRHVKRELGIDSTQKVVNLVGRILSHLRVGLSLRETNTLMNRLPGLFQLLLMKNWKRDDKPKSFTHLDELAECIYREDKETKSPLFTTEIQALDAVVVILNKLNKYLNFFSLQVLNFQLIEGLKKIPQQEVA